MLPDLLEEYTLRAVGYARVAGVDEVGRGAWAGPVCAAAVVLPLYRSDLTERLAGVRDSKRLTPRQRERCALCIEEMAEAIGVGWASAEEVDALGIVPATRRAMARAIANLQGQADALVVDAVDLPEIALPQRVLVKADVHCLSVAAASVVAKVTRDRLMVALEQEFPGYGFARHKGYGTAEHRAALTCLGPSRLHRRSWRPLQPFDDGQRV